MKAFTGAKWRMGKEWGFWFRIYGYGLVASTLKPIFSERHGHTKTLRIGGVKIQFLRRERI